MNTGLFNCDGDNDQVNDSVCATTVSIPPEPIADLRVQGNPASVTHTSDADFNTGGMNSTGIRDTGNGASIVLLTSTPDTGTGAYGPCIWNGNLTTSGTYNCTTVSIYGTNTVTGSLPLIIKSTGDVTIDGTINLNGGNAGTGKSRGAAGPGGYRGGEGEWGGFGNEQGTNGEGTGGGGRGTNGSDDCAGGGGGFGGTGGQGGGGSCGGTGGGTYNSGLMPLEGGSGGGGGRTKIGNDAGAGGGGGGAIQISAQGTITISNGAAINADGGKGGPGFSYYAACGGGGSGGAILLEAPQITHSGTLSVKGGQGGNGGGSPCVASGGGGGGGRVILKTNNLTGSGTINTQGGSGANSGTSGTYTPTSLTITYYGSGTFTSSPIDLGDPSYFSTLSWNTTIPGAAATIDLEMQSGDVVTSCADATWGSWQTAVAITTGNQSSSALIPSALNNKRCVQYRATLSTTDPAQTPIFHDITINYESTVNTLVSDQGIGLTWTAPGDNYTQPGVGQTASYDLRMSTAPILNDTDFGSATQVTGLPAPQPAGNPESFVVGSLADGSLTIAPDITYYFAIKSTDSAWSVSAINTGVYGCTADTSAQSTCVTTVSTDTIPPNPVTDLNVAMLSSGDMEITWTAPGDDGAIVGGLPVTGYDVRYWSCDPTPVPCTVDITDANWDTLPGYTQLTGAPASPAPMGNPEAFQFTLPTPTDTVNYFFALRSIDDAAPTPNRSSVSNIVQWTPTVINSNTTLTSGQYNYDDLHVLSGYTLTLNDGVIVNAIRVTVNSGGTIVVNGSATINANILTIDGTIDASGRGCQGGIGGSSNAYGWDGQNCVENGTGFGGAANGSTSADVWGGGGGGHGGNGGDGYTSLGAYGGASYGSMTAPVEPGAGGGWSVLSCCWTYVNGGSGGGAIQMNISGPLTVNGQILANGGNGQLSGGCTNYRYGGGGAGGSIYITTDSIAGSGVIQARGGNGATACGGGGGGAGGRVAIYASQSATFPEGNISVAGGSGNGEPGTVQYLYPISDPPVVVNNPATDITIASDTTWPSTWGWGTYIYNNITINSGVTLTINGRVTIDARGDFTNNGTITADGKGCGPETGPDSYGSINCIVGATGAAGVVTTYGKDGGGGYGGKGGGDSSHDPGEPYGYDVQPVDLGSGGGNNYWQGQVESYGGTGGGAIRIKVAGTMKNYGIISTNGTAQGSGGRQQGNGGAAGSGGSIWVTADSLDARGGVFRAEGGEYGAGGGGGRIALQITNPVSFTGAISCKGGRALAWPDAGDGQSGTCYVVPFVDITGITPAVAPQSITNYPLVISGANFSPGVNVVSFGGTGIDVNSITVDSDTQITVYISVASNASAGVMDVTVANSIRGSDTLSGIFSITPAPTVTSVSPNTGGQGDTLTLSISGNYFVNGAGVSIGGSGVTVLSTTVDSATSITAQISIDAAASVGQRDVIVTNPDGGVGVLSGGFTVMMGSP